MDAFDTVREFAETLAGPARLPFATGTSVRKLEVQIGDLLDAADVAADAELVTRANVWQPI